MAAVAVGDSFARVPRGEIGARHGVEMAYVFGHPSAAWTDADRALADAIATYWTHFAKIGDANGEGLPTWQTFASPGEPVLWIDTDIAAGALPSTSYLAAIDLLYTALRLARRHLPLVAGVALAIVVASLALLAHTPLSHRKRPSSEAS